MLSKSINHQIRRFSRTLIGQVFVFTSLFSMNLSLAQLPSETIDPFGEYQEWYSPAILSVSDTDFGLKGPLSMGLNYGSLDEQFIANAQYTESLFDDVAISFLGEIGSDMYRVGGTLGFNLFTDGMAKISAERFSQELPFSFESGAITEDVAQNAYGARYQHLFKNNIFSNLNAGIYYADAPNIGLDPVEFSLDGDMAINHRNIAGGTSKGLDVGTDLQLTDMTTLSAQLYYDHLRYKTKYTENSEDDAQGLGGGLGIKQLLNDRIALSVIGDVREIYDTYTAGISWLPASVEGMEISLLGQRIESHNDTPDSNIVGLQFGFNFGIGGGSARYAIAPLDNQQDLETWAQVPAVYMDQVLAVSDEAVEVLSKDATENSLRTAVAPPTVTALSPISGPPSGGTTVILTGTGFTDATAIHFGTHLASHFTVNSDTQITVTSPAASAGVINVTVTTPAGTSANASGNQFTYQVAPTITSIKPNIGLPSGGTSVTITGTHFIGASAVYFGGNPGTNLVVHTGNSITVTTPAAVAGDVEVTVTTPSGSSPVTDNTVFTYQNIPTVTGVTPNVGPMMGGTNITITGSGFTHATTLHFGNRGVNSSAFTVVSDTEIVAVTTKGSAGEKHITVTTPVGTSNATSADIFHYQAGPKVTKLSPAVGNIAGGTTVIMTGNNFTNVTAVKFGNENALSYTVDSATQITALAPSGSGVVNARVTTMGGTSPKNGNNQFTYQDVPTITSLSPVVGKPTGGTTVTITGTNLLGTTAVYFGNNLATNVAVHSATSLTVHSPPGVANTTVNITAVTPSGTSAVTPNAVFTYEAQPNVTGLSPNIGSTLGNNQVILTGTGFIAASAVKFGNVNAQSFTVISATEIIAVSPPNSAGNDYVTVTTPMGTSAHHNTNIYTYQAPPAVNTIAPVMGAQAGGTSVTISGAGFTHVTGVHFGAVPATSYTVNSATSITAVSPPGTDVVDITVTTAGGISAIGTSDQFTYIKPPTVNNISPNAGLPEGGTAVTISGTDFTTTTAVHFGATPAVFEIQDASTIIALSPPGTGTVHVTVTSIGGTSNTSTDDEFTYEGMPSVSSISPNIGLPSGNTLVTIQGLNFTDATAVNFGSIAGTIQNVSNDTIIVQSPSNADGSIVNVSVITPVGTSVENVEFTYASVPTITDVSPDVGSLSGGTSVTIAGSGFFNVASVYFGSHLVTDIAVNSSGTEMVVKSPPSSAGTVDIQVTTPGGEAIANGAFTYEGPPVVMGITPNAGLPDGGTTVVITGENFISTTAVMFGNNLASFKVNSATQITATSPPGTNGDIVNITVTTPVGTSIPSAADEFAYELLPVIDSLSPNKGDVAGGTEVIINGENFIDTSNVRFGNQDAKFVINSPTQITVISPPGEVGPVDVVITTPIGNSSGKQTAQEFLYISLASIVITPSNTTIIKNQQQQLKAMGIWTDGSTQDLSDEVTWVSHNPQVATISTTGLVTALIPGESMMTTSLMNGVTAGSTMIYVTEVSTSSDEDLATNRSLNPLTSAAMKTFTPKIYTSQLDAPEEIILPLEEATLYEKAVLKTYALGVYEDRIEDLSTVAIWESRDPKVAIVNDEGMITAIAPGKTTIRARFKDVFQDMEILVEQVYDK